MHIAGALKVCVNLFFKTTLTRQKKCALKEQAVTIDRRAKQRIGGAGTATATEPTREHKQHAIQGPTT